MLRAQVVVCLGFFKWLDRRNNGRPDSRCSCIDYKEQPIFHEVEPRTPFIKPLHMWHNNWWPRNATQVRLNQDAVARPSDDDDDDDELQNYVDTLFVFGFVKPKGI